MRAALEAADAGRLVQQTLWRPDIVALLHRALAVDVVAIGKAAAQMTVAFTATAPIPVRSTTVIGPGDAGHPIPDARSVRNAERVLDIAQAVGYPELMVVLLSGGASALMTLPARGLTLEDKQIITRRLLAAGVDIAELNSVRKHLSAIKGGQLAAGCAGSTLTLALSDVAGDDLSVIGSGPTVADTSTWGMALDVLDRRGGRELYPSRAVRLLECGTARELPETPKPNDPRLARSRALVVGGRTNAMAGARNAAESLGYHVHVVAEPVIGLARQAAEVHAGRIERLLPTLSGPACIISSGETTVRVTGRGTGGRNQEFALAMAARLATIGGSIAAASVGTDGIDGPTDAAGALVDSTTLARAAAAGLDPAAHLDDNNSYAFFKALDDLVRLGPTDTNVGDLQVVLVEK